MNYENLKRSQHQRNETLLPFLTSLLFYSFLALIFVFFCVYA